MKHLVWNLLFDERGQDLIEYTLLLAFVTFTSAGMFWGIGGNVAGITGKAAEPKTLTTVAAPDLRWNCLSVVAQLARRSPVPTDCTPSHPEVC